MLYFFSIDISAEVNKITLVMGFLNQRLEKVAKEMDTPLVSQHLRADISPEEEERMRLGMTDKSYWVTPDDPVQNNTAPSYSPFGPRRHSTRDIDRFWWDKVYDDPSRESLNDAVRAAVISEYKQNLANKGKRPPVDVLKPYATLVDNGIKDHRRNEYRDEARELRAKFDGKPYWWFVTSGNRHGDWLFNYHRIKRYKTLKDAVDHARRLELGRLDNLTELNLHYPASSSLWHSR